MTYTESDKSIFRIDPKKYYYVHCISGDYALGSGVAKEIDKRFRMREKLHDEYPLLPWEKYGHVGQALLVDHVFNLVVKPRFYHKANYKTLRKALISLRDKCQDNGITNIVMPRLCCGYDKLAWTGVFCTIAEVFSTTNINILVCFKGL